MEELKEASLSRVWKYFNDQDTTIVILTAFRDEVSSEISKQKNKKFASELKRAGFGYFYVDGHFPENECTNDEVDVSEDSIFAIAEKSESKKLIDFCHKLANSENQDSIIVKDANDNNKTYFLTKDGTKDYLGGEMKPGKHYTKLRNKKSTNTFIFEAERDGRGFIKSFRDLYNKTAECDS